MADFVQSANVKSATRTLAEPIADVATFNTIVQSVITDNPFECVAYMTAGESHPPVEKTKEAYTAKLVYQDTMAKTVGTGSHKFDTLARFNRWRDCAACRRCGQHGTRRLRGPRSREAMPSAQP